MYKELETNIVKDLMKYKDFPFPEDNETFPTRSNVAEYLQSYAASISSKIVHFKYNSNVISLTKTKGETPHWELVSEDVTVKNATPVTQQYDYVILSQGHFDTPYIPDVEGLKNWSEKLSGSITHAKYYNAAADYKDKKVLIIGNGASGIDIATQVFTTASKVIVSSSAPSNMADIKIPGVEEIDRIAKYDFENDRTVITDSGVKLSGIDVVIFCTGYLYTIPFLKSYLDGETAVLTNGDQIRYVYKQLFYIPDPTLIHAGLGKFVIPFPLAECQAQYVSRVLSGRVKLPSTDDMLKSYQEELKSKGEGKPFHDLKPPKDSGYCNELFDLIEGTTDQGFVAEYWDEKKIELRSRTPALKAARLEKIVSHAQALKAKNQPFVLLRGPAN
ncbi:unnamed protein product [Ambrosiozyma monospora]|uniref:Unnamed protein product n=1 Tax=Ambrosiozyma monospora TaxID=43982 RepID=A0ACB5T850_AMBMO|nr:unnamed protein product [Ambrosiozyma monospora]